jgi:hypothetical protein
MAGGLEGDTFIGPKAEEYRGLLRKKPYVMKTTQCGLCFIYTKFFLLI